MEFLCVLTLGLALVTVVGHGIWVMLAAFFRGGFAPGRPERAARESRPRGRCPNCQGRVWPEDETCAACGLDLHGAEADELTDLEATARQLERFEQSGLLNQVVVGRLRSALELRRRRLRPEAPSVSEPQPGKPAEPDEHVRIPRALPVGPAPPATAIPRVAPPLPWQRLQQLLGDGRPVDALTPSEQIHVLLWFGQSTEEQLACLPPGAQLGLARLLRQAGRGAEALAAYRRFLAGPADHPALVPAALEAARLALSVNDRKQAEWSLQRALARDLLPDQRREADELRERLHPAPPEPRPAVAPPPEPVPPRRPRRSLGELLAAFMEERNILWGELVGGLLIVGCSIALVISLWQTLEEIPYFPFLVFAGITTALFGAGLYTLHHWKLEATSRGLLAIATLLVPLNFLVLAGLGGQGDGQLMTLLVTGAALAVFGWLVGHAARVFVPEGGGWLPPAVLGGAAAQLLVPSLLGAAAPGLMHLLVLGGLPVFCYGLGVGGVVGRTARGLSPARAQVVGVLAFLGFASFALAVALGFVIFLAAQAGGIGRALNGLAAEIALAGLPVLACGLLLHRRLESAEPSLAAYRTAGTALALGGTLVMLVGLVLAWPQPVALLVVGGLNFVLLTAIAFRLQLPLAHAAALPCLAAGYLSAAHLLSGALAGGPDGLLSVTMLRQTLVDWGGWVLAPLVLALAAAGEILARVHQRRHAAPYALGSLAAAGLSALLVSLNGLEAPAVAAGVCACYAVAGFAANVRWQRPLAGDATWLFVLAATVWGLEATWPALGLLLETGDWAAWAVRASVWSAVLAVEALALAVLAVRPTLPGYLAGPLTRGCRVVAGLAVVVGIMSGALASWQGAAVVAGAALAAQYLLMAAVRQRIGLARLAGLFLIGTVVAGAGWAGTHWAARDLTALVALAVAAAGTALAAAGVWAARPRSAETAGGLPEWCAVLAPAWLEAGIAAAVLGFGLALLAPSAAGPGLLPATLAVLAATALLLAGHYRAAVLSWVGSALVLAGSAHALYVNLIDLPVNQRVLLALLSHATLGLLAGLVLRTRDISATRQRVYARPLLHSALAATVLAVPPALAGGAGQMVVLAGGLAWLAVLWRVAAWAEGSALWFTAYQLALMAAVLDGVTAWLEGRSWLIDNSPGGLLDPRSLQAYAGGLAVLCLAWAAVRVLLRRERPERGWPALDRPLRFVLVLALMTLAVGGASFAAVQEIVPRGLVPDWPAPLNEQASGPGAWVVLALLAGVFGLGLWERQPRAAAFGLVLLAGTIPILAAGSFAPELAVASALRWGLAVAFLAGSAVLWVRVPLVRLAGRLGIRTGPGGRLTDAVRSFLMAGQVVPILALTVIVVLVRLLGGPGTGPGAASWFRQIGLTASLSLPLVLVCVGLVGHALREGAAGFAFAAGLVGNFAFVAGQALQTIQMTGRLTAVDWVRLGQWGTVAAAVWALGWLASRGRVRAWRPGPDNRLARPLMRAQVGLGLLGNAALVMCGFLALVLAFPGPRGPLTSALYVPSPPWVPAVGSLLGWLAFGLAVAALVLRSWPRRVGLSANAWGWVVLAGLALLACSVERLGPSWGYRTFLINCGFGALAVSLGAWTVEGRTLVVERTPEPSATAAYWVRLAGGLVLVLGLKAAVVHHDHLWAAGAIALVALAGAALAVWLRREDWAFAAGLGMNLAASLVVWHAHRLQDLPDWWVPLVQANVIAWSASALFWLWMRWRLYEAAEVRRDPGRLLLTQVLLACLGNALLLVVPLNALVTEPGRLPGGLPRVGEVWGWLALLLTLAAAAWYVGQAAARVAIHLVGGLALALGVLLACTVSRWDAGNWLAFHVLMMAWTAAGAALLVLDWLIARRAPASAVAEADDLAALRFNPFPAALHGWVTGVGAALVVLALRGGWDDPQRPFWSAAVALAGSGLFGMLALRTGLAWYGYVSGPLVNLAGIFLWLAWGPATAASFVLTNVVCLGAGSFVGSAVALARRSLPVKRTGLRPYRHEAALAGVVVLASLIPAGIGARWLQDAAPLTGPLAWSALIAVAVALTIGLWDATARFTRPALYTTGLLGLAFLLEHAELAPRPFGWTVSLLLAGYVSLTVLIARFPPRVPGWPVPPQPRPGTWFPATQAVAGGVVTVLSLWVCLSFAGTAERLAGPLALVLPLPAGVLLTGMTAGRWAAGFRAATLGLTVVALTEAGWAVLDPGVAAPWLHRTVILMATVGVMRYLYLLAAPRLPERFADWAAAARLCAGRLGFAGLILVLVVLVQEVALYDFSTKRTPLAGPGILAVALALVVLMVVAVRCAVVPGRDPFGWPEQRRTRYVYGCEVLLLLLFVHLRLNVPEMFGGLAARYWTFIVMALAFLGVGLSEHFTRRGLPVLAGPLQRTGLFLPLLPLLAFWFQPPAALQELARENLPAAAPLLNAVKRPAGGFATYAALWFTVGLLFTLLAVSRRRFRYALLAALAVNCGLWALFYHHGWLFLAHPQLWLIPLALILLVSEHVNRDRLSRGQSTALRYLALGMLYLSSTADMFITGVGQSVVLPLVLVVLSVLGVLAGILLRVRAFLFLGVAFLFLVIFAMIWHAAVDRTQTWVWWASGIVLGVGVVALFAVFEKRRNDVLRLIEEIKKWD